MTSFPSISFQQVYREHNSSVDGLSKEALVLEPSLLSFMEFFGRRGNWGWHFDNSFKVAVSAPLGAFRWLTHLFFIRVEFILTLWPFMAHLMSSFMTFDCHRPLWGKVFFIPPGCFLGYAISVHCVLFSWLCRSLLGDISGSFGLLGVFVSLFVLWLRD